MSRVRRPPGERVRLTGIERIKKSAEVDRFLGSLSPEEADAILRIVREVAGGRVDAHPSLLFTNLYYVIPGGLKITISVRDELLVVLDIRRVPS